MQERADPMPIWTPAPDRIERARITAFRHWLARERGREFARYEDLWQWSVAQPEAFWRSVVDHFELKLEGSTDVVLALPPEAMPGARWFPGATLNFAAHLLGDGRTGTALTFDSEAAGSGEVSWAELQRQAGALAATLRQRGVRPGDRVAAYLPNIPQAVVAFIAVASLGAVWSICAPDVGPLGAADRFAQIEPAVLIACDGYRFAGKPFDRRATVEQLLERLPRVHTVIWVPHLDGAARAPTERPHVDWATAVAGDAALELSPVPFDHPLWILFSSGTTGLPKAIVHGHGGMLLSGTVLSALHTDLGTGDRMMWLGSTSWMVWNVQVMGLLTGSTVCLQDGCLTGPGAPDWSFAWRLVARRGVTVFGAGAAFHTSCMKAGIEPSKIADLGALRTVGSTGSPLPPEGYAWIYRAVAPDVWLNAVSGGTDLCGAFLAGTPTLPVFTGEMQCRALGAAVASFDEQGEAVLDQVGELVCTRPLPSMPLFFWGDADGSRYRESYFGTFSDADGRNIWRHGDWLRLVPRPDATGGVIYGRSDATINRGGIRMGTSELYRVVDADPAIADSVVVDLEYLGRESALLLFVVLQPDAELDAALVERLRAAIRSALSARHVPDRIIEAPALPRTLTGKKLELPLKRLLLGMSIDKAVQKDAVSNAHALDWFVAFAARERPSATAARS
ncbi:acetoacetate--CoA ligase [Piscinibacter koreensis]|uniref:acetoacetate--CoA ligase n=1 Tax=Piscinibacter koreensis TaxID=2742824 RepID=UPI003CC90C9D